jgi:DNA-binding CsgD family transcriptional regulator
MLENLTPKEQLICKMVSKYYSRKTIAEILHVSVRMVDTHLYHIYAKVGCVSYLDLIRVLNSECEK